MKVNTEQAFDMLPHAADIYTNLNLKEYFKKNQVKPKKDEDLTAAKKLAGIDAIAYILKNSPKAKNEFFHIVAIFEEKTVDEVKKQPITTTIKTIKEIMTDEELMDFFTQVA